MLNSVFLIGNIIGKCIFDDSADDELTYKMHIKCLNGDTPELETDVYIWSGLAEVADSKTDDAIAVGIKGYLKMVNGQLKVMAKRVSFMQVANDD